MIEIGGDKILKVVDVNTVDAFQGQEKDIIILSCVRGGANRGIGFLGDVRRMNVAFTRAKCSLFVLGNADALETNEQWFSFVKDARKRGVMTNWKDADNLKVSAFPGNLFGDMTNKRKSEGAIRDRFSY